MEDTKIDVEVTKNYCRYHHRCTKIDDPEHAAQYICVYKKPCRNGLQCIKIHDENHNKFFTHNDVKKNIGKLRTKIIVTYAISSNDNHGLNYFQVQGGYIDNIDNDLDLDKLRKYIIYNIKNHHKKFGKCQYAIVAEVKFTTTYVTSNGLRLNLDKFTSS